MGSESQKTQVHKKSRGVVCGGRGGEGWWGGEAKARLSRLKRN